jgi:membrane-associated phospholipid phosphatase
MNKLILKLKSFDHVIILYSIITALIIIAGNNKLQNILPHLLIRFIFILIIFFLIYLERRENRTLLFFRNFYPLLFLSFFYGETDYLNNLIFNNLDSILVNIDQFLFGLQPSLKFSEYIASNWFSEVMHFGYFSYYLFTFGVPLLFYIHKPEQFEKALFIIISSFSIYYLFFIVFPSIGPQFYFQINQTFVPEGYLFDKIMHLITEYGETETGAFPSSHIGMTVIFLILIWKNFKYYFKILLTPAILLIFSTVYLKAHYAIDIFAGAISGYIFYLISIRLHKLVNKQNH